MSELVVPAALSTVALWSALGEERRDEAADELDRIVRRHAAALAEELAQQADALRAALDDAGASSLAPASSSAASAPVRPRGEASRIGRPPAGEAPDADVVAAVRLLERATRAAICRKLGFTVNNAYFRAMPAQLERLAQESGPLAEDGMHGTGKAYRLRLGATGLDRVQLDAAEQRIRDRESAHASAPERTPAAAPPGASVVVRSSRLLPPATAMPSATAGTSASGEVDSEILRVCAEAPLHVEDIADAIGFTRLAVVRRAQALVDAGRLERCGHRYTTPRAEALA